LEGLVFLHIPEDEEKTVESLICSTVGYCMQCNNVLWCMYE
jgi:hypothetical protein